MVSAENFEGGGGMMFKVLRKLFGYRERLFVRFRLDFDLVKKRWKFVDLCGRK